MSLNQIAADRPAVGSAIRSPLEFPDSPLAMALKQPMMMGLFLPTQAGGWSASTLPRTTDWTFDYNLALTKRAEELGYDLVFSLAQWLPKGGNGGVLNGTQIEPMITTAALSAVTSRILLVATIHILYGPWHPLHIAKFGATLDHITKGRWGINIVTGHRAVEHAMFGWQRIEHDLRYDMAAEFMDVVNELWSNPENFSYEGKKWRMEGAFINPKPRFGRPILVSATGSDKGIDFASRYSDIIFITSPAGAEIENALGALPAHVARVKAEAAQHGRNIRTLINPMVVCRETDAEAQEYYDAIASHVDPAAPKGMLTFDSDAQGWKGRLERDGYSRMAVGGNIQLVGSPEKIVHNMVRLKKAGVDGIQMNFFDFKPDLEFFGERVIPLMKQAGLRL
ncbi:MAG: LLM class flavin-dependent oxidoreductase [Reyranellaceae bacterium]